MSGSSSTTRTTRFEALRWTSPNPPASEVRALARFDGHLTGSIVGKSVSLLGPPHSLDPKSSTQVLLERRASARNEPGKAGQTGRTISREFHVRGATRACE